MSAGGGVRVKRKLKHRSRGSSLLLMPLIWRARGEMREGMYVSINEKWRGRGTLSDWWWPHRAHHGLLGIIN